jgi:hypothetical protein
MRVDEAVIVMSETWVEVEVHAHVHLGRGCSDTHTSAS